MPSLRGQSKALNVDDTLKPEYSISLMGSQYPLLTAKGSYTSKLTKKGKTRFNKLFNGTAADKKAYIKHVRSLTNRYNESSSVGDSKTVANPTSVKADPLVGKQPPLKVKASSSGPVPDSLQALKQEAENAQKQKKEEEPEDNSMLREEAKRVEDENEEKEKTKQAIQKIGDSIPKMSRGGHLKGRSHKQGGIKMKVGGTLDSKPVDQIEVEDGEYVVNKESTKHFKQELEQMNSAGNAVRDARGTHQEDEKQARLRKLKERLKNKKFCRGGHIDEYGKGGAVKRTPSKIAMDGNALARKWRGFFNAYKGKTNTARQKAAFHKNFAYFSNILEETGMSEKVAETLIKTTLQNEDNTKSARLITKFKSAAKDGKMDADLMEHAVPAAPQGTPQRPGTPPTPAPPKHDDLDERFANLPSPGKGAPASGGKGLMGQLSQDDGVNDSSMYPVPVGKFFTKLDFSRTLRYVKNKHKEVESMDINKLRDMCQDLASELQISLKYSGSDVGQMKDQLYQLMAIKLGRDKGKGGDAGKTVGMVVDVESMFGKGAEINKDKLQQQLSFRRGGVLDVKKYARGGGVKTKPRQGVNTDPLRQMMEDPDEVEKVVDQGFTEAKPESKESFNDFQKLAGDGPGQESAFSNELRFKRRTFNLGEALLNAEQNWRTRHAEKVDEIKQEYGKGGIFRIRKSKPRKGRRNLL